MMVNWTFCQWGVLFIGHSVNWTFCLAIVIGRFVKWMFYQLGVLSIIGVLSRSLDTMTMEVMLYMGKMYKIEQL